eukprot:scaffold343_cov584-Prasinococcus_capsulatus_cf.AAC.7
MLSVERFTSIRTVVLNTCLLSAHLAGPLRGHPPKQLPPIASACCRRYKQRRSFGHRAVDLAASAES